MARFTLADFTAAEIAASGVTQADLDAHWDRERAYLDQPARQITEEAWDDALGVLPPENWHTNADGINSFRCMEYMTGSVTAQYAKFNGKYVTKYIDVGDKSTWISIEDMANAVERP